jgi:hypothetical protein
MHSALVIRFFFGGALVSLFSLCGDLFKPKSLSGIFSASPAVALVIIGLTLSDQDPWRIALQGKALLAGGVSLTICCLLTAYLVGKDGLLRWASPLIAGAQWLAVWLGLWLYFLW